MEKMTGSIFNEAFWTEHWQYDCVGDTQRVHKGFATPDYWDQASKTYDTNPDECRSRKFEETLADLNRSGLLFDGMNVLDIGCGTGSLALALAEKGARVTGVDFSSGMLDIFQKRIPKDLKPRICLVKADWQTLDIGQYHWTKKFDLVTAFMSPGVSTPKRFYKMMACADKGCAIRGWAQKFPTPILVELWKKIAGTPLEDRPQSILYKINLLFSLGYFPDIRFDTVCWDQTAKKADEFERQLSFFKRICTLNETLLSDEISAYLEKIAVDGCVVRHHRGKTATVIWRVDQCRENKICGC